MKLAKIGDVLVCPPDVTNPYTYRGPTYAGDGRAQALRDARDGKGDLVLWYAPACGGARRIRPDEVDWTGLRDAPPRGANGVKRTGAGTTEKQSEVLRAMLRLVQEARRGGEDLGAAAARRSMTPSEIAKDAGVASGRVLGPSWFTAAAEALRRDGLVLRAGSGAYHLTSAGLEKAAEAAGAGR